MAARKQRPPLVLVATGRKGGVGKTSTVAALAAIMAEKRSTLLVDLDPQGSAATALGVRLDSGLTTARVLAGEGIEGAPVERCPKLRVWAGSPALELVTRDTHGAGALSDAIGRAGFEVVAIDCATGHPWLERMAARAAEDAGKRGVALAVSTIEPLAVATLARALDAVSAIHRRALVCTRVRAADVAIIEELRGELVGYTVFSVPQDAAVPRAALRRLPLPAVAPKSRALAELQNLAHWIGG